MVEELLAHTGPATRKAVQPHLSRLHRDGTGAVRQRLLLRAGDGIPAVLDHLAALTVGQVPVVSR